MKKNIDILFNPKSIAIIGASSNPSKAGYAVLHNLTQIGCKKKIYPVTPSSKEILGYKCYKKLSEIPDTVELVVLGTPAHLIFEMMEDLEVRMKSKGDVKAIVCIAADYGETKTAEGIGRQKCLMDMAEKYDIRVVGPNCIGIIDNVNRIDTTFIETTIPKEKRGRGGKISFISQSGAVATAILMQGASNPNPIEVNKFVSIGNMADVDFIDLLEFLEEDEDTKVIGMYMEGYKDGKKLIDTLARIVKKKPVVVLKVGRSDIGAVAANSHTGSLAGSDSVYDAAFKQFGVTRVYTIDELIDTLGAFSSLSLPKGKNCYILTQAGGPGIYCTDAYEDEGNLHMPATSKKTDEELIKVLPPMANVGSPIGYSDITAAANASQHAESLRIVLEDRDVDSVILITVVPTFVSREDLANELVRVLNESNKENKPVYICIMSGNYVKDCRRRIEEAAVYTFATPEKAVKAVSHMTRYSEFIGRKR